MRRFFVPGAISENVVRLSDDESYHARAVLRITAGQRVILFDGQGSQFEAIVTSVDDGQVVCEVANVLETTSELGTRVTVAQAVIKGSHFDYAVQKCVETGAAEIIPFLSARCVRLPGSVEKFTLRAQRIASEAAKQCGRAIVPIVRTIASFEDMLALAGQTPSVVAYEKELGITLREFLKTGCPRELAIIIGPEGGFEALEIEALLKAGASAVSLGPRILRSETAAPYMLAQIAYECE